MLRTSFLLLIALFVSCTSAFVVKSHEATRHATTCHRMFEASDQTTSSTDSAVDAFDGYMAGSTQQVVTKDLVVGSGETPEYGNIVTAAYKGKILATGATFDEGELSFKKGFNDCMPGFEQGIGGLRVGGKRMIRIPPAFAYGAKGSTSGVVPPNTDLEFEVELQSVKSDGLSDFLYQYGIGRNRKTAALAAMLVLFAVYPMLTKT